MNQRNEKQPRIDVYIYRLPVHVAREFIGATFEAAGFPVAAINIFERKQTQTPGVREAHAFVRLENPAQARAAIIALKNFKCDDLTAIVTRYKTVEEKRAESDQEARAMKMKERNQSSSYKSPACESWARHQSGTTNEATR